MTLKCVECGGSDVRRVRVVVNDNPVPAGVGRPPEPVKLIACTKCGRFEVDNSDRPKPPPAE